MTDHHKHRLARHLCMLACALLLSMLVMMYVSSPVISSRVEAVKQTVAEINYKKNKDQNDLLSDRFKEMHPAE